MISTGSGGVGKTTTAAAIATMAAVHLGGKVLVLTVDPAKRLANALGLEQFGNTETRVPSDAFGEAGVEPRGELWAAMLDTKQSWDDLVRQHAPDAATRDAILANPLYKNITGKFIQGHDYVAMERLYEIHTSGRYDLIVVDTPPTRNAIDFLDAPDRMADFFSSRLLRWLIAPYRSRVVGLASKPFYSVADRILGSQFLSDIAEFFILFQSMYDGFVERAKAVTRLLESPSTTFVVVSTLEAAPAREAQFFMQAPRGTEAAPGWAGAEQGAARRHLHRRGSGGGSPDVQRGGEGRDRAGRRRRRWRRGGGAPRSRAWPRWARTSTTTRWWRPGRPSSAPSWRAAAEVVATVPILDDDVTDLSGLDPHRRASVAMTTVETLTYADRAHLDRLVADWAMLADFCFSDLLLYVASGPDALEVKAHIRPATSQTIYHSDLVGEQRSNVQRPLVAQALATGELVTGEVESTWLGGRVQVMAIPVRRSRSGHRGDGPRVGPDRPPLPG